VPIVKQRRVITRPDATSGAGQEYGGGFVTA
jgi:hypothetical protein